MDFKNISTKDLINELKNRKEVEVYVSGLYRRYEVKIKEKYRDYRRTIELEDNSTVLVIKE